MPDLAPNNQGKLVRQHKPHAVRPAIDRFKDMTVESTLTDFDGSPCLLWDGGNTFRVTDGRITTPHRFIYEHESKETLGRSWTVDAACGTSGCCQYSHLVKVKINQKKK